MGRCLLTVSCGGTGAGFCACEVTHLPISSVDRGLRDDKRPNICVTARICALYSLDGQGQNGNSGLLVSIIRIRGWTI